MPPTSTAAVCGPTASRRDCSPRQTKERSSGTTSRACVTRNAKDHVGFGHGVHRCAGAYLAQLEMQALLRAMVTRVETIEVGKPQFLVNNVLRGYRSFRVSFGRNRCHD